MRGIETAGIHLPRHRLASSELKAAWGTSQATGVATKTVPAADEDSLTMAISAAESALSRSRVESADIVHLGMATTTPPVEAEMLAPRVARGLGLGDTLNLSEHTQSTLAGASALRDGFAAAGPALVVAADAPEGDPANSDHPYGAGAVAFILTDSGRVTLRDRSAYSDELPGVQFRPRGNTETTSLDSTSYERSAISDSVVAATEALEDSIETVTAAALPQPDGGIPYRVGRALPLDNDAIGRGTVVDRIGSTGAAAVPLGLLSALESAGSDDVTLAVFFASGGAAEAVVFDGGLSTDLLASVDDGTEISYSEYLRERGYLGRGSVDGGGAHVSLPTWLQSLDSRYRLVAGQCPECDELTFPPSGACKSCYERVSFDRIELPREGTVNVHTVIGQGGAPPEFADQQRRSGPFAVALVTIAVDDRTVTIPAQLADVDPSTVETGDRVKATIRRIYETEGIPRYGVKFAPAD